MTQDGDADDLWAATRPEGMPPPTPPPPPGDTAEFLGDTSDPTTTMPGVDAVGAGGPPPPAPPGDEPTDDGTGGARVVYEPPFGDDPFTDDEATSAAEDAFRVYDAAMARSPDTLYLRAFLGVPASRTCDASEFPT